VQIPSQTKFGNGRRLDRSRPQSRCQRGPPDLRHRRRCPTQFAKFELPFLIFSASSIPLITMVADSKLLSPSIGRNRCFILRWRSVANPPKPPTTRGPQESIRSRQLRPLHRTLQNTELMTEGQNLKLKRRSLAKESQESRRQRHQRRRTRESKEERQTPIYQQLRGLREPQSSWQTGCR